MRYSRGSKVAGIVAGTYGTVLGVNPIENLLTIQKASGDQISYDPRRLSGVSVYREMEREFSVGDRIQFTAPDKHLGVANRELGTIEKIDANGNISLRLEDSRNVQFNATEHPISTTDTRLPAIVHKVCLRIVCSSISIRPSILSSSIPVSPTLQYRVQASRLKSTQAARQI